MLDDDVAAFARREQWMMSDRWSVYAQLRDEAPFYPFRSTILVSRYADVERILSDEDYFQTGPFAADSDGFRDVAEDLDAADRAKVREILDFQSHWMTSTNEAKHDQLRRLGMRVFTARAVAQMQATVDVVVGELLDEAAVRARSGDVEFIRTVAFTLPMTVISRILDIPDDTRDRLHASWQSMLKFLGGLEWRRALPRDLDVVHAQYQEMNTLLSEFIAVKRRSTDSDLLRLLFAAQQEDPNITDADLIGILSQLFTAGHQTTQDLLGNTVYLLMTHRSVWDELVADPSLAKPVIEEVLRYRSPAQDMERTATKDVTVGDYEISAGQHVTCLIGSANLDPTVFAHADEFDVHRPDVKAHLAFSRGPHFCLGAALSRMEAVTTLSALVARFPDMGLADDEITWMPNTHLMGVAELPLTLNGR